MALMGKLGDSVYHLGFQGNRILFATDTPWGDFEGEYHRLASVAGDGDRARRPGSSR